MDFEMPLMLPREFKNKDQMISLGLKETDKGYSHNIIVSRMKF